MVDINLQVSAAIYICEWLLSTYSYDSLSQHTKYINSLLGAETYQQWRISTYRLFDISAEGDINLQAPADMYLQTGTENLQCTSSSNTECSCRRVAWRWSIVLEHWPEAGRLHYSSIPDKRRCFQFAIIRGNTLANCCYWVAFSICNLFAVLTSKCNAVHMLVQCISWLLLANGCY